jgi:hypothetical protein
MDSSFDPVENLLPFLKKEWFLLNLILETGIEIPAEIIESLISWSFCPDASKIRTVIIERRLQIKKGGHHINHLKTRIINIITNLCCKAVPLENSGYCVTQNRIPQVANMHSFVGIDTRVFDKDLMFGWRNRLSERLSFLENFGDEVLSQARPIHFEIEVPGRRDINLIDIRRKVGSQSLSQFLSDLHWRFPSLFCQGQTDRAGEITHFSLRRDIEGDLFNIQEFP